MSDKLLTIDEVTQAFKLYHGACESYRIGFIDASKRDEDVNKAFDIITRIIDGREVDGQIKGMRKTLDLLDKSLNPVHRAQIYQLIAQLEQQK